MSVKSLERRLASVLTQAFDDCPTLRGRFRLLDCFSDLVHRPVIAEELQRKHSLMVQDFAGEVALVMQVRVVAIVVVVVFCFFFKIYLRKSYVIIQMNWLFRIVC